jgi:hypothetical protein
LNQAQIRQELPAQALTLVQKIKNDPNIDINMDWKLITIWIGGNDLCEICENYAAHSPTLYEQNMRATLNILKASTERLHYCQTSNNLKIDLPRTLVNLVKTIDVSKLYELNSFGCSVSHLRFYTQKNVLFQLLHAFECACGTSSNIVEREAATMGARDYNM